MDDIENEQRYRRGSARYAECNGFPKLSVTLPSLRIFIDLLGKLLALAALDGNIRLRLLPRWQTILGI